MVRALDLPHKVLEMRQSASEEGWHAMPPLALNDVLKVSLHNMPVTVPKDKETLSPGSRTSVKCGFDEDHC